MSILFTNQPSIIPLREKTFDGQSTGLFQTEAKTIELEPLMSKNYHPWDTITWPDITWTPSANILYTLIIFDAGAYISHGVYINISEINRSIICCECYRFKSLLK
jgi:hypothetical protein